MAKLFFLPGRSAIDLNGLVVSGAEITFYLTGTNIKQSVYANAGLTTPLTNPVKANAAGRFPSIYLNEAKIYRVKGYDPSDGVTLFDVDPYYPGDASELSADMLTKWTEALAAAASATASAAEAIETLADVNEAGPIQVAVVQAAGAAEVAEVDAAGAVQVALAAAQVALADAEADRAEVARTAVEAVAGGLVILPELLKPDVIGYDSFDRPNGAIGTANSGQVWNVESGGVLIASNKLWRGAGNTNGLVTLNLGTADVDLTASFVNLSAANAWIILRYVDASNYIYVTQDVTGVRVRYYAAGVLASMTTVAGGGGLTTVKLRAAIQGNLLSIWRNDVLVEDKRTIPTALMTATGAGVKHGVYVASTTEVDSVIMRKPEALPAVLDSTTIPVIAMLPKLLAPNLTVYDSFNRANGDLGNADSGQPWIITGGTADILAKKVRNVSGATTLRIMEDTKSPDMDVTIGFERADEGLTLRYRYASETSFAAILFSVDRVTLIRPGATNVSYTVAAGLLPAGYDWTAAMTARAVLRGNLMTFYLSNATEANKQVFSVRFTVEDMALFGANTQAGFYVRNLARVSYFEARKPDATLTNIAALQDTVMVPRHHDALIREVTEIAVREAAAPVTLEVLTPASQSFPGLSGASDYFRGWINFPGGGGLLLARSSGYFVVRRPDGTMFTTTLGIPPGDFGTTEWNMSGPCLAGPYIVFPPRDSGFVGVVEWRKLFDEARVNEAGYALKKYTFGLPWGTSLDKFTGSQFAYDRYVVFYPTDFGQVFIWDIVTGKAWFDSFGINFATGAGGKKYIGGVQGFKGDFWMVPFAAEKIVRFNILTGDAYAGDFGLNLKSYVLDGSGMPTATLATEQNKWSGMALGLDYGLWGAPRASTNGILHIDEFNSTTPASFIRADENNVIPNWGAGAELGGFGVNRFITCPNFHLLGGARGNDKLVYVDTLKRSFRLTDFGYQAAHGSPLPSGVLDQIGGIATPQGTVDFSPSSSTLFLRATWDLSEPTPSRLLLDPAINKGT